MNDTDNMQTPQTDEWPPEKGQAAATDAAHDDAIDPSLTQQDNATSSQPSGGEELLCEILAGVYRAEGMAAQGFAALRERLAVIEARLGIAVDSGAPTVATGELQVATAGGEDELSPGGEQGSQVQVVAEVASEREMQSDASEAETFPELPPTAAPVAQPTAGAAQLPPTAQPVAQASQQIPQPVQPVRDVHPVATESAGGELAALVFGRDLAYHESLTPQRQTLLAAVRQGQEDALGLAGQILTIRAATMDRLPTLLKDVGEAWYRWRGDDGGAPDPLREALIQWLHSRLEAVGLGNRIELVRVGDRYDSKRHNAKARGVEVVGVQGWVVLRDNGNVYTKANVTVA